jgi:hypothetical protein
VSGPLGGAWHKRNVHNYSTIQKLPLGAVSEHKMSENGQRRVHLAQIIAWDSGDNERVIASKGAYSSCVVVARCCLLQSIVNDYQKVLGPKQVGDQSRH